jgi:hypothetical protein
MKKLVLLLAVSWIMSIPEAASQSYVAEKNNPKIKIKPAIAIQAWAFNLKDVRLLNGSPFKNAMDRDGAYLLVLETGRLLHAFIQTPGCPPGATSMAAGKVKGCRAIPLAIISLPAP